MTNRDDRIKLLHEALAERILVIGGPYGTYIHGRDLTAADYGGAAVRGLPRAAHRHPPGRHRGRPPRLPRGRRRHHRDEHLRRRLDRPRRVRARRTASARSTRPRRGSRAQVADAYSTPARPRFVAGTIGPDDEGHLGHRRHHVRRDGRTSSTAGRRASSPAASTCCCSRRRTTRARSRPRSSASSALFDELGFRVPVMVSGTIEPTGTMLAGQTPEALAASLHARRPALARAQLRDRPGVHDGPHPHASRRSTEFRTSVLAERRPARRGRQVPRDADADGGGARALRRQRLAEHRRRLLRHDVRAHRAPSRRWSRASARASPAKHAPHAVLRHRLRRGRRRRPAADRRRAHERGRLAQVQAPDRATRSTRRRARSRAGR